jgi:hypothetical protein
MRSGKALYESSRTLRVRRAAGSTVERGSDREGKAAKVGPRSQAAPAASLARGCSVAIGESRLLGLLYFCWYTFPLAGKLIVYCLFFLDNFASTSIDNAVVLRVTCIVVDIPDNRRVITTILLHFVV